MACTPVGIGRMPRRSLAIAHGHAPHLLAILNNTVVGLVARQGRTNVAEARREFARSGWSELSLLLPLEWSISHETDFATALYISDKNLDNHKISWHYFHNEKSFF
jgi:hypothetical protein